MNAQIELQKWGIDAQVDWKFRFHHWRSLTKFSERRKIRKAMYQIRREAALERKLTSAEARAAQAEAERDTLKSKLRELEIPCKKCHGSGFIYDNVCDCSGGSIGYATPEMIAQLKAERDEARRQLAQAQVRLESAEINEAMSRDVEEDLAAMKMYPKRPEEEAYDVY